MFKKKTSICFFVSIDARILISKRYYDVTGRRGRMQDTKENLNLLAEIHAPGGYVVIPPAFFTQKRILSV
ncbi:unnamed protein product [Brassica rapa subsp. trilocularis]